MQAISLLHLRLASGLLFGAAVAGAQNSSKPTLQFDVVSIKLNLSGQQRGVMQVSPDGDRIVVTNAPMFRIVEFAFDFQRNDLVLGAPAWTFTERWDLEAKVAASDLAAFHALNFKQQKALLQPVLEERCRMQAKIVDKEIPVYALTVARGGIRMHEVTAEEPLPVVRDASGKVVQEWDLTQKPGQLRGRAVPIDALIYALSSASIGRQVIDRTTLKGNYNFDLLWTPQTDLDADPELRRAPVPPAAPCALPSLPRCRNSSASASSQPEPPYPHSASSGSNVPASN